VALDLGLKGYPQRFVDYQRMILGKQLLGRARQLTPPAPGWSFHQYTLGKESLDDGTIGLNRSFGMGECSLQMERLGGRETDRVQCPGSRHQHHPPRTLLDLLARYGASPPVDHITQSLRWTARSGRPHSLVHVNVAEPSPDRAMDNHRREDIEGSIGWIQIPHCYITLESAGGPIGRVGSEV
jgi:hypothetical protein